MIKRIISTLVLMLVFYGSPSSHASANQNSLFKTSAFLTSIGHNGDFSFFQANTFSIKRGEPYDETKDPALRKGTENWEQDQGSYIAIPALVLGIFAVFLFFNRGE